MYTENMIQFFKTGNAGACPICGNELTVNIIETPIRKNYDIVCDNCNKSSLFSGTAKEMGDYNE